MFIVAIVGKKGSGKTTAANLLVNKLGFERMSFAARLKETAKVLFDFSHDQVWGHLKETVDERYGITPRQVLQDLGTEFIQFHMTKKFPEFNKRVGRGFWVQCMLQDLNRKLQQAPNAGVVIDDCRFPHEEASIREWARACGVQFKCIRIVRKVAEETVDLHASEMELQNIQCDSIINNDIRIEELEDEIKKAIR